MLETYLIVLTNITLINLIKLKREIKCKFRSKKKAKNQRTKKINRHIHNDSGDFNTFLFTTHSGRLGEISLKTYRI